VWGFFLVTIHFKLAEIHNVLLREIKISAIQVDHRKLDQTGIQGLLGLHIPLYFCTVALLFGFPCNY